MSPRDCPCCGQSSHLGNVQNLTVYGSERPALFAPTLRRKVWTTRSPEVYLNIIHSVFLWKQGNITCVKYYCTDIFQNIAVCGELCLNSTFPMGSPNRLILKPILLMNALKVNINSLLITFADDTKIDRMIINDEERVVIQEDLYWKMNWPHLKKKKFY